MEIRTTYFGKFEKNGKIISGIWCGTRPEDATITEERNILFPDDRLRIKIIWKNLMTVKDMGMRVEMLDAVLKPLFQ